MLLAVALTLCAFLLASSCARSRVREVHVHDRHALSYRLVSEYARAHGPVTLVSFDYHHDVAPSDPGTTSFDWIGDLITEGSVKQVLWISGRDLTLPNRESREHWLVRSLGDEAPSRSDFLRSAIELLDWNEIKDLKIRGPFVVTVDLDVLTVDPGNPPERFLCEMRDWIARRKPALVTIALSSAYQKDESRAWDWLARLAAGGFGYDARWYLEAGNFTRAPESKEESRSWERWQRTGSAFLPGAANWLFPPESAREALLDNAILPGDEAARDVIAAWNDPERAALEGSFTETKFESLADVARASIAERWKTGRAMDEPAGTGAEFGIAVRLQINETDRGCLALFSGVGDVDSSAAYCAQMAVSDPRYDPVRPDEAETLTVEISAFGPWRPMSGPLDFRPGVDSVMLETFGARTLLQSSLVEERGLGREEFLGILSRKAGLGTDGWKDAGITFYRSLTLWRQLRLGGNPALPKSK